MSDKPSEALELADTGMVASVGAREAELRDVLIRCLGSQTVEELVEMGQWDALLEEILAALVRVVGPEVILKIFLPQYVIQ